MHAQYISLVHMFTAGELVGAVLYGRKSVKLELCLGPRASTV